jgi:hypothetical protein
VDAFEEDADDDEVAAAALHSKAKKNKKKNKAGKAAEVVVHQETKQEVAYTSDRGHRGGFSGRGRARGGRGGGQDRQTTTCNWCQKPGHWEAKCFAKERYLQNTPSYQGGTATAFQGSINYSQNQGNFNAGL